MFCCILWTLLDMHECGYFQPWRSWKETIKLWTWRFWGLGVEYQKPTHLVGDIDLNDTKSVLSYIAPFQVPTRYGSKKLSISQTLCICKSTGGPRGHNDQEYILSFLSFVPCRGQCSTYCRYMQITKFAHTHSSDHATI